MTKQIVVLFFSVLPILSFTQEVKSPDSTLIVNWKISPFNTFVKGVSLDTNFIDRLQAASFYHEDFSVANLGNSNSPSVSNIFAHRDHSAKPFFLLPYQRYIYSPYEEMFFDTKRPFSEVFYSYLPGKKDKDDSRLSAILTQNVNPHLNLGMKFNFMGSDGQYLNQKSKIGGGALFSSFSKGIYTLHVSLGLSKINMQQNGGLYDMNEAWDPENETKAIPVNLSKANTTIHSRYLFLNHKINFKADTSKLEDTRSHLSHTLVYSPNYRTYKDNLNALDNTGQNAMDSVYYTRYYPHAQRNSNIHILDTCYYKSLYNELRYSQRIFEDKISIGGFWANQLDYYYSAFNDTADSVVSDRYNFSSNYIGGIARLNVSEKSGLLAYVRYGLSGYRQNDLTMNAILTTYFTDSLWSRVDGFFKKEVPDYFMQRFRSSYYDWSRSVVPQIYYGVDGMVVWEKANIKVGGNFTIVQNYLYFDSTTLPKQAEYLEGVTTWYLQHHLKVWLLHWENRLTYQEATSDIFSIPRWAWYTRFYIDHVVRFNFTGGGFRFALGGEAWYNSRFNNYNYSPVAEQFYYQSDKIGSDYTFSNLFLNAQVKRLRVFVRYENFTTLFVKYNYYSINDYPYPRTAFKLGLAWTFYD